MNYFHFKIVTVGETYGLKKGIKILITVKFLLKHKEDFSMNLRISNLYNIFVYAYNLLIN